MEIVSPTRKQTNLNVTEESAINKNEKPETVAIVQEKVPQGHPLVRAELVKQSRRAQALGSDEPGFQCT